MNTYQHLMLSSANQEPFFKAQEQELYNSGSFSDHFSTDFTNRSEFHSTQQIFDDRDDVNFIDYRNSQNSFNEEENVYIQPSINNDEDNPFLQPDSPILNDPFHSPKE